MQTCKLIQATAVVAGTLATCVISAQAADQFMVVPGPAELKWGDTGPQFPNTQLVILEGDPSKKGPVTLRWRCPDGYKFLPHTHPGTERVTVLAGGMVMAIGEKYDAGKLGAVQQGGYAVIPAKAPHYGECKGDTTLEIHTMGPLGTTYVNPADDPSKKK
jgi:hypothetical protein